MSTVSRTRGLAPRRVLAAFGELTGRLRPAFGSASLVVLVVTGVWIAASGIGTPTFLNGVHHLPGWGTGALHTPPLHLTAAQFYLVLAAMALAYAGVVVTASVLPARAVVGAIVLLHVVFFLAPPLLSADVFSYIDYARLGALHHLDPYVATPSQAPHDPVFRFVHWRATRSAYGPLFTLVSYPLARLGPGGALWAFKALAMLSSLGCIALVWRIARRIGVAPVGAVAMLGLNPLLLVWALGGAHNDLLMLLVMFAGVALVIAARETLGGAVLTAAVAIKATAGLAIPFVVLGAKRRSRVAAGALAAAAALVAIAVNRFPDHAVGLVHVLRHQQHFVAGDSVPLGMARLLGLPEVTAPVRLGGMLLFAGALSWLAVRAFRREDWIAACGWAYVALVASSTWFVAWYTVWPLPFAALARDRRLLIATVALQVYYVINHVPIVHP